MTRLIETGQKTVQRLVAKLTQVSDGTQRPRRMVERNGHAPKYVGKRLTLQSSFRNG